MKYRIKIITFKSGDITYHPQVKKLLWWFYINYKGKAALFSGQGEELKNTAKILIQDHMDRVNSPKDIEYDYIDIN